MKANESICIMLIIGQDGASVFVGLPSGFGDTLFFYVFCVHIKLCDSSPNHNSVLYYDCQTFIGIQTSMLALGSRDTGRRGFAHPALILSITVELLRRRRSQQRKKGCKKRGKRGGVLFKSKRFWTTQMTSLAPHVDQFELSHSWLVPVEPNETLPAYRRIQRQLFHRNGGVMLPSRAIGIIVNTSFLIGNWM